MSEPQLSEQDLKDFKKWQSSQQYDEPNNLPNTEGRLDSFFKKELNNRQPVTLPREYMWGIVAGGTVLILTAWPVLILGIVLGAFAMFKVGCPCTTKPKQE